MFPWLFLWTPQFHFPFSGAVKQDIAPSTDAFFGAIAPAAGDGRVEKAIFEQASYGKQIGILSDVIFSLVAADRVTSDDANRARDRFVRLHDDIEKIKGTHRQHRVDAAIAILETLQKTDPDEVERIVARFQTRAGGAGPRTTGREPPGP
jgi:hypothetical protein